MNAPARGGWFVALLALVLLALTVMAGEVVLGLADLLAERHEQVGATTYEFQVCRDGEWSPSYDAAALPGEWVKVDAGTCGVRWREATP